MAAIPLQARVLLSIAATALLAATIAGALASHALGVLETSERASFETATQFLFFHGLGLVVVTLVGLRNVGGLWLWGAAWLLVAGMALFSGSIIARTLGAPSGLVALAPYGGTALMAGWLVFGASVWRRC